MNADILSQCSRIERTEQRWRHSTASSSRSIACLRSAAFQRFRKSSRLANRFFSAALVKSRRDSVTSLPFSSRYSTRSAMMRAPMPST